MTTKKAAPKKATAKKEAPKKEAKKAAPKKAAAKKEAPKKEAKKAAPKKAAVKKTTVTPAVPSFEWTEELKQTAHNKLLVEYNRVEPEKRKTLHVEYCPDGTAKTRGRAKQVHSVKI